MRQLLSTVLIAAAIEACGLLLANTASAVDVKFNRQTDNVYSYTLSLEADEVLQQEDTIDFINLLGVTNVALSSQGQNYFSFDFAPDGTSASFTVTSPLNGTTTSVLNDVFNLTSTASGGNIDISVVASDPSSNIEPSESYFTQTGPAVAATAVPFEFSPSYGLLLLLAFAGKRSYKSWYMRFCQFKGKAN